MSLGRGIGFLGRTTLSRSLLRAGLVSGQGSVVSGRRELSHVPVDDLIGGLTEEQSQVRWLVLPADMTMSAVGLAPLIMGAFPLIDHIASDYHMNGC